MNDQAPIPLEQEMPALAEHIRQVVNRQHPVVERLLVGRETCRQAGLQAEHAVITHDGRCLVKKLPDLGRNDPCYCGSGKKYKKCHLNLAA